MNDDFGTTLTLLLDDVATTIDPRSDFDAVRTDALHGAADRTPLDTRDPRRFRRGVAIAAASVLLVGAGAAAYRSADGDAGSLATADVTTVESTRTAGPTAATAVPATNDGDAADEPHGSLDGAKPDRDDRREQPSAVARTAQAGRVDVSSGVASGEGVRHGTRRRDGDRHHVVRQRHDRVRCGRFVDGHPRSRGSTRR